MYNHTVYYIYMYRYVQRLLDTHFPTRLIPWLSWFSKRIEIWLYNIPSFLWYAFIMKMKTNSNKTASLRYLHIDRPKSGLQYLGRDMWFKELNEKYLILCDSDTIPMHCTTLCSCAEAMNDGKWDALPGTSLVVVPSLLVHVVVCSHYSTDGSLNRNAYVLSKLYLWFARRA